MIVDSLKDDQNKHHKLIAIDITQRFNLNREFNCWDAEP